MHTSVLGVSVVWKSGKWRTQNSCYPAVARVGKQTALFSCGAVKVRGAVHAATCLDLGKVRLNCSSHLQRTTCVIHFCVQIRQTHSDREHIRPQGERDEGSLEGFENVFWLGTVWKDVLYYEATNI